MKAICLPSGDQRGEVSPLHDRRFSSTDATCRMSRHRCCGFFEGFARSIGDERNVLLSGDHWVSPSFSPRRRLLLWLVLARSITHMCARLSSYQPVSLNLYWLSCSGARH